MWRWLSSRYAFRFNGEYITEYTSIFLTCLLWHYCALLDRTVLPQPTIARGLARRWLKTRISTQSRKSTQKTHELQDIISIIKCETIVAPAPCLTQWCPVWPSLPELIFAALWLIVGFALLGPANVLHPISTALVLEDPKFRDRGALL